MKSYYNNQMDSNRPHNAILIDKKAYGHHFDRTIECVQPISNPETGKPLTLLVFIEDKLKIEGAHLYSESRVYE